MLFLSSSPRFQFDRNRNANVKQNGKKKEVRKEEEGAERGKL